MSGNTEILTKAIQKAIDGGWRAYWIAKDAFRVCYLTIEPLGDGTDSLETPCVEYSLSKPKEFIFNHDFAKALWGEKTIGVFKGFGYEPGVDDTDPGDEYNIYDDVIAWQYHLQQMVIAEDPIKYLGEHLND